MVLKVFLYEIIFIKTKIFLLIDKATNQILERSLLWKAIVSVCRWHDLIGRNPKDSQKKH